MSSATYSWPPAFDGSRQIRKSYSPPTSATPGVPASYPTSELSWIIPAQALTKQLLQPFAEVSEVYAHYANAELHLYVADTLEQPSADYADALALLEVRLSKALENNFEDVVVHSLPLDDAKGDRLGFYRNGVKLAIRYA